VKKETEYFPVVYSAFIFSGGLLRKMAGRQMRELVKLKRNDYQNPK